MAHCTAIGGVRRGRRITSIEKCRRPRHLRAVDPCCATTRPDLDRLFRDAPLHIASHGGDLPGFHGFIARSLDGSWAVILLDNHDGTHLPELAQKVIEIIARPQ